jgi:hypothetical protein
VDRDRTAVGPDSVGSRLGLDSISFGGNTLTASLLSLSNVKYESRQDFSTRDLRA